MQITNKVLMIEPSNFFSNPETLIDNKFQSQANDKKLNELVINEYKLLKQTLIKLGIDILDFKDLSENNSPDSIFPNNWFSTHFDETLIIYPLMSSIRRKERREDIINFLRLQYPLLIDLSHYEIRDIFLEGTGSLIFDRINKIVYSSLSKRSNKDLILKLASLLNYKPVIFSASDKAGNPIYHTNVIMSIGDKFALVCKDAITNIKEWEIVRDNISSSGKTLITITLEQVFDFCGNIIQLNTKNNIPLVALSTRSFNALNHQQKDLLSTFGNLVHVPIPNIETYGGGGVRCMIAELF
ncbi:MAG: amidinotransferase [Rivularia sp. T60_A2020_040]|nr:amidinotransferase [Rivularia sp. T60_A2020_040]